MVRDQFLGLKPYYNPILLTTDSPNQFMSLNFEFDFFVLNYNVAF